MTLQKNLEKECFCSIDELPIWNWWRITDTGNLKYLYKEDVEEVDSGVHDVWEKVHNEYLEEFGFTEDFKKVLRLKKKWILKQAEFIVKGNRFASTEADIINMDIEEMTGEASMDRSEIIIFLEEKLSRAIDPKELTVRKYNEYIKYYNKKHK